MRLAPSLQLSTDYRDLREDRPYPFAVRVEKKLKAEDFVGLLREKYEGTAFEPGREGDLSGGPFGSPDRWTKPADEPQFLGNFERTITLFRSVSSFVIQARPGLPPSVGGVIWWGPHCAHTTCFVPLLPGAMNEVPYALRHIYQGKRDMATSFWVHRYVFNLSQLKFKPMFADIRAVQGQREAASVALVKSIEDRYRSKGDAGLTAEDREAITDLLTKNVNSVRDDFLKLFDDLMFKFADGYLNEWGPDGFSSVPTGYPQWWLRKVGYTEGPRAVPADSCYAVEKTLGGEDLIQLS
jgi:dipeptidase